MDQYPKKLTTSRTVRRQLGEYFTPFLHSYSQIWLPPRRTPRDWTGSETGSETHVVVDAEHARAEFLDDGAVEHDGPVHPVPRRRALKQEPEVQTCAWRLLLDYRSSCWATSTRTVDKRSTQRKVKLSCLSVLW